MSVINKLLSTYQSGGLRETARIGFLSLAHRVESFGNVELAFTPPEYIRWLTSCVPGFLHPGNVAAMDYALRHLPDGSPMLEIGSYCGLSTCVLGYLRQKYGVKNPLYNCDCWIFEGQEFGKPLGDSKFITHDQYQEFTRDSYLRNVRMFCQPDLPHTVVAYSDEFFQRWNEGKEVTDAFGHPARMGGPLSFCYIDGNHTYDFARRDFENTDRHLVPGGFILFDDSADGSAWEVCRVVAEVLRGGKYRVVAKNPNYLVQKVP